MVNFYENPTEKPKIEPLKETPEKGKEEEMEIDPEVLKSIEKEIEKEKKEVKNPISLFPKKLQKFMAIALLGLTIGSGVMAREAEAGGRSRGGSYIGTAIERAFGRGFEDVGRHVSRGIGENLEDVFKRMGRGLTPQEYHRVVNWRIDRARRLQDLQDRLVYYETQRELSGYEGEKKMILRNYYNDLKGAKTKADMELAQNKLDQAMTNLDKMYGRDASAGQEINKGTEAPKTSEATPETTLGNSSKINKDSWKKAAEEVTYEDKNIQM